MDSKFAVQIGVAVGLFVFGGVFFKMASEGEIIMGFFGGGMFGAVSILMTIGLLSPFTEKDLPSNTHEIKIQEHPSQESHFTFDISKEDKISPAGYGYWSVRWASDSSRGYLKDETSEYWKTFHMHLNLQALFIASYWVYAIQISGAPEDIIEKFEIGFKDGLKDLLEPDGTPLSERNGEFLYAYYRRYFVSLNEELGNPESNSGAVFSDLSEKFIESIEYYFFKEDKMGVAERIRLTHQIAGMPLVVFDVLKKQGLEFHA